MNDGQDHSKLCQTLRLNGAYKQTKFERNQFTNLWMQHSLFFDKTTNVSLSPLNIDHVNLNSYRIHEILKWYVSKVNKILSGSAKNCSLSVYILLPFTQSMKVNKACITNQVIPINAIINTYFVSGSGFYCNIISPTSFLSTSLSIPT